jgi:hypothetical protein
MIMNAKAARLTAQKVVDDRNKAREEREKNKALEAIEKAKKDKKDYLFWFKSYLDSEIADAVKAGKTYCTKDLQPGYDYRTEAEKAFKFHPYIKEVTKILDEYRRSGYIIEESVNPQEHYSYSETNGSEYECTTYTAFYTINW